MLVDFMSGEPIERVPYEKEYRRVMSRMLPAEIAAIKELLNEMITLSQPAICSGVHPSARRSQTRALSLGSFSRMTWRRLRWI